MPSEVFAEDIEAYLEQLEGVERARVEATEDGELARVYLIAGPGRDNAGVRRAVEAALLTRFNLPIDARRIQVAHLDADVQRPPARGVRLDRVEEALSATQIAVSVELRYERRGKEHTTTGRAALPPGPANRLRAAALAAADAARAAALFDGRPSVERVEVLGGGGRGVAVVTLTFLEPHLKPAVGAALVATSEAEAVIAAVLDAAAPIEANSADEEDAMKDRMDRLEALRARYQRVLRGPAETPAASVAPEPEDVLRDVREIRPTGAPPEAAKPEPRAAPRPPMEEAYYRRLIEGGVALRIRCRDGYELRRAVLREYGTYALLVEHEGGEEFVYKHAILSLHPETGR